MRNRPFAVLLLLVAVSVCVANLPAHAGRLYWTANEGDTVPGLNGWLASVRTDGLGFFPDLYESPGSPNSVYLLGSVAVDSDAGRLYWIETDLVDLVTRIVRGDADSCQTLPLEFEGRGLALDPARGKLYWTEDPPGSSNGRIRRANLDFSSVETVLGGLDYPSKIGVDSPRGQIYWYDGIGENVLRSSLDGSQVETLFGIENLGRLRIDSVGAKLYWSQWDPDGLRRADLDGSNVEELAPQVLGRFDLDLSAGVVYWPTGGGWGGGMPQIRYADLDGSNEGVLLQAWRAQASSFVFDPSDELIRLACGTDVPALGLRGAAILVLLLLAVGTPFLLRRSRRWRRRDEVG